ncbi:MAG: hypothetical protein LM522_08285, partial [Candidatus Contendobacter sp.]|nr:hypothetical protein [Candidatus Contendobacter sp.]
CFWDRGFYGAGDQSFLIQLVTPHDLIQMSNQVVNRRPFGLRTRQIRHQHGNSIPANNQGLDNRRTGRFLSLSQQIQQVFQLWDKATILENPMNWEAPLIV